MRLATNDMAVSVGGQAIALRPSLRAAARLEHRYGGFDKIIRDIAECKVGTIIDVIAEGANTPTFAFSSDRPLQPILKPLLEPLVRFVIMLAGVDPDKEPEPRQAAEKTTFADYHERLYKYGTGWLGWTPEQTWLATPAEIIAAIQGRQDMLAAIFGRNGTSESSITEATLDDIRHLGGPF